MDENAAIFGARVRAYRVAAGVSQAELAERSGMSVRAISNLERGRTRWPHRDSVFRLADALNLTEAARSDLTALAGRRLTEPVPGDVPGASVLGASVLGAGAGGSVIPRELPNTVSHFVGRARELKELTALLDDTGTPSHGSVVISAIGGTAGVGKTALAVQWAQWAAARFPDGQLYVDLRGYDQQPPLDAVTVLARFLRSLGVPGPDIPADEAELAGRYRTLLAGKRMLIVLDNAHDVHQVRPLLPGTSRCLTLVTSRDSLSGLVAREGAKRLDLDVLPLADAIALLEQLIGDRAGADPAMTRELALACDRLPLALRVAAEVTAVRSTEPLSVFVAELAGHRLDRLHTVSDTRTAVRTVFSWSYRHLDTEAAAGFRMAGLHPGPGFDRYAIAALTGSTAERAGQVLDVLAHAHLIQPGSPGRYHMHDLLRAYAGELAEPAERVAATGRLLDFYLQTAAAAMDAAYRGDTAIRPVVPQTSSPELTFADRSAARQWLDAERANLVAATVYAADTGMSRQASRMSGTLFRYLDAGGYVAEALAVHEHARSAAVVAGDRAAEAAALVGLATLDFRQGRHLQAAGRYQQATALFAEVGDQAGQARAQHNLGLIDGHRGDKEGARTHFLHALKLYRDSADKTWEGRVLADLGLIERGHGRLQHAAEYFNQALRICRETGDRVAEARILIRQGSMDLRLGRLGQALDTFELALAICAENGDRYGEAEVLSWLGSVHLRREDYGQATECLQQALSSCEELGYPSVVADALNSLGQVDFRLGHPVAAIDLLQRSAVVARELGDPEREAEARIALGEVLLATGQLETARDQYSAALELVSGGHERYQEAQAHHGLGDVQRALGDVKLAGQHWRQAHAIYADLGVPEASETRAKLANSL
jgi:tetratricopeptide (TPR) repeat protein/DNA-binding XRE family transcriptional regulator